VIIDVIVNTNDSDKIFKESQLELRFENQRWLSEYCSKNVSQLQTKAISF